MDFVILRKKDNVALFTGNESKTFSIIEKLAKKTNKLVCEYITAAKWLKKTNASQTYDTPYTKRITPLLDNTFNEIVHEVSNKTGRTSANSIYGYPKAISFARDAFGDCYVETVNAHANDIRTRLNIPTKVDIAALLEISNYARFCPIVRIPDTITPAMVDPDPIIATNKLIVRDDDDLFDVIIAKLCAMSFICKSIIDDGDFDIENSNAMLKIIGLNMVVLPDDDTNTGDIDVIVDSLT